MITIREPIKTTLRPTVSAAGDGFAESINANYGIITGTIAPEDLLHMVTTPPEIYIAEGGGSSVVNQTNLRQNREENIEIVNNLINRIMVSADARLTYQDRVYITSVLNKLGIRDDRRFMNEVRKYFADHKSINKLIELYEEHGERLGDIVREYRTDSRIEQPSQTATVNEGDELHLHKEIYSRLFTGEYGDIIQRFNKNSLNENYISSTELALTDVTRLSRNLYLNELRSLARDEDVPLIYRQENYYEDTALEVTDEGDTNLQQSLTSAVLLNMVERAYNARFSSISSNVNHSYDMRSSFYHSVDNLLTDFKVRVENYLEGNTYVRNEQRIDGRSYNSEIALINNLVTALPADSTEDIYRINEQNIINRERYIENLERITQRVTPRQEDAGDVRRRNRDEALRALGDPEAVKLQFREEGRELQRQQAETAPPYIEALPAESREIFRRVEEYLTSGDQSLLGGSTVDNIGRLSADITLLSAAGRSEIIREATETVVRDSAREMVERLTEREIATGAPGVRQRVTSDAATVDLVHRRTENTVSEELIEEIRQQRRLIANRESNREETVNTTQTTHTTVVNNSINKVEEKNTNIEEIVRNSVKSQLGTITDRVYSRLERRLGSERSRRGY